MKAGFQGASERNVADSFSSYAHQNIPFHNPIIQASQNRKLIAIIQHLFDQMNRLCPHTIVLPGRARKSPSAPSAIIQCIDKGAAQTAEKELQGHITHLHHAILKLPEFQAKEEWRLRKGK